MVRWQIWTNRHFSHTEAPMDILTNRSRKRISQRQLRHRLRETRRQQARKARLGRRRLEQIHDQLPKQVRTIFDTVEPAFSNERSVVD